MATSGVRVIAKFGDIKDVEKFQKAAKEVIEATRKEPGCRMYELFEEVDGSSGDPAFILLEWWDSLDDLKNHVGTPHVKVFVQKRQELVGAREVKKYKSLGL